MGEYRPVMSDYRESRAQRTAGSEFPQARELEKLLDYEPDTGTNVIGIEVMVDYRNIRAVKESGPDKVDNAIGTGNPCLVDTVVRWELFGVWEVFFGRCLGDVWGLSPGDMAIVRIMMELDYAKQSTADDGRLRSRNDSRILRAKRVKGDLEVWTYVRTCPASHYEFASATTCLRLSRFEAHSGLKLESKVEKFRVILQVLRKVVQHQSFILSRACRATLTLNLDRMTWLLDAKYHGQGVVIDEMGRTGPEWGYESVGEAAILSLALVLYDWVITLDDEIHFMWSGKFMWTRILFAVDRELDTETETDCPPGNDSIHNVFLAISDPSDHICKIWYFYFVFSVPGSALPTTFIAQLRIYAMYNCNRRLFFFMFAYVSTTLTFQLPILMLMIVKTETFRLPPTYTACFGTVPYPYTLPYFIQWVPYLTYEIFMFVLAMYKSVLLAREHPETPHLIYVLLRDSLVFYGGTLAMVLVNCLVNALGRSRGCVSLCAGGASREPESASSLGREYVRSERASGEPRGRDKREGKRQEEYGEAGTNAMGARGISETKVRRKSQSEEGRIKGGRAKDGDDSEGRGKGWTARKGERVRGRDKRVNGEEGRTMSREGERTREMEGDGERA
ncbi:hypothetical protein K474DRAFT_1676483 [Panus rudis PR-1116 ss-1]|nr:hypothetical protein K474DRAFT_1676483 [Panus rudis PR-1116 ss-1]